jgi:hypothetical protein
MKINISELRSGKMVKGASSLKRVDDLFYSYSTKIAQLTNSDLLCNPNKYSATTSKQLSALQKFYRNKGYTIMNW